MDDAEFAEAFTAAAEVAPDEGTPTEETVVEEVAPEAVEPEAVEEEEVEEAEEPEAPQFGEEVSAYLSKYGGDVGKALEAALHAQSKLGEQGQELGELRRMVQEMYDREPAKAAPSSPFVPENLQDAIVDNPSQVAAWALQSEQSHIYEAAISEWYEQNPKDAARFERALEREMLKAELTQQVQPEITAVREQQQARQVADAHRSLSSKYPDFQQVLETATSDELAGIDRNLLATAQQQNPEAALELVYRWVAMGRGQRAAAETAQRTNEVRQEKREAAVVTADTATEPIAEPTVMDKLAASMLGPDPWDTRGPS